MLGFAASGSAVFAVEGYVKHACAKFLRELRLQLQALRHAAGGAAVVVANGQQPELGLCAK